MAVSSLKERGQRPKKLVSSLNDLPVIVISAPTKLRSAVRRVDE
jgi:hypothetical protein